MSVLPVPTSHEWDIMRQQAEVIAASGLAPSSLRNRPEAILAIAIKGRELELPPMVSLSHIHIIEGKPAVSAELQRALAFRAGCEIWPDENNNNTRCTLYGKRPGSDKVYAATFTMEDAKRANLLGKFNWKAYPDAMLLARATSKLLRLMAPDILMGASYTPEELGVEHTDEEGIPVRQDDPIAAIPDFTIEAEVVEDEPTPSPAEPEGDEPTKDQYARFHAILNDNNIDEDDYRAAMMQLYHVNSVSKLKRAQLDALIRRLSQPTGPAAFRGAADDWHSKGDARADWGSAG